MSPLQIVWLTLLAMLLLATLVWLILRPHIRLRQVSRYLRRLLADPEGENHVPRSLRSAGSELSALRERLIVRQEEERQAERRRQDLIAFLAHDLKTPLTSVLGYLELLRDEPNLSGEQRAKYVGIALNKAKRLEELVGEFFDINTLDLTLQTHDSIQLSFLLEQLADEFYPQFATRELSCQQDIQPHLVVEGDGDKLARVFDNVLRNAISYSTPGSTVGLTARKVGEQAVVSISNEGLEIPERELANIFEKFYRLDAARSTSTGGAGLGLAIAKEIVALHGGTIRAESTGSRTIFHIALPLKKPEKGKN